MAIERTPLPELYRLQDELTSLARAAGISDLDIRVDEAQRVVVVDARTTAVDIDGVLAPLIDQRVSVRRPRRGDAQP